VSRLDERIAAVRRGPRGRHLPPDGGSELVNLRRWIARELVTEEVLAHEARAAGMTSRGIESGGEQEGHPSATSLRAAVGRLVELVTASVTVARREVRGYYVRNGDRYRRPEARRVRHVLVPDATTAEGVAGRLAAGESMAALARAVSIDPGSRTTGGLLGDVHRGELSGPFEDALFEAEVGAIVGPIQTGHGWHVARVEAVTPAGCVAYAEARPAIEAELLEAARSRRFAEWLEGRRQAIAVIEPEFAHPADPILGIPSHRH